MAGAGGEAGIFSASTAAGKVMLDFTAARATLPAMSTTPRPWSAIEPLESRIAPAFAATLNLSTLDGINGFKIQGEARLDFAGTSVGAAGDINGDGFADFIIGAVGATPNGYRFAGTSYVLFGKAGGFTTPVNLSSLDGKNGFKIQGEDTYDQSGCSVSGVGDVNGDGFDDIIIGTNQALPQADNTGVSYVVFGKARGFTPTLNLSTLTGVNGFKIMGEAKDDRAGYSVSGAGDVNGDGFADLLIGAPFAEPNGRYSGASYVVFGKAKGFASSLALSSLNGSNGFKIQGEKASDRAGHSVSRAGDVNGDGFADLIIGASGTDPNVTGSGASYVVFGKAAGFLTPLNLSSLNGANGFKIPSDAVNFVFGTSVSGVGDVNGDGFDDFLVNGSVRSQANVVGAVYLIFGKAGGFGGSLNLSSLDGGNGVRLIGEAVDNAGPAGDVNGDGLADLIIGAPGAAPNGSTSGATYVMFGRVGGFGTTLDLSTLNGVGGFKLDGEAAEDSSGSSVSGAGDINGDGFADLIIGAASSSPNGLGSGAGYVVFGKPDVKITFSKNGKIGTFVDSDGDLVTVKVSKGVLSQRDFIFGDGVWQRLDLTTKGESAFGGAAINITARKGLSGNGTVDLGAIDARGLDLATVTIDGDLGQIDVGDANFKTPAIRSLTVGSLGAATGNQIPRTVNPVVSDVVGTLWKLNAMGNVNGVVNVTGGLGANIGSVSIGGDLDGSAGGALAGLLRAGGNIGSVEVNGSIIGGADFSGVIAGGKLGRVKVGFDLTSADATKPVTLSALGTVGATKPRNTVAIAGVNVAVNVLNARILAGYNSSLGAANFDAGIGPIVVGNNWTASSVAAGIADSTGDGFGRNDTRIAGDTTPKFLATIASITIKGTATGSSATGDFYGITAERIAKAKIGGTNATLTTGAEDQLLDATNSDFRLVDFA